MKRSLVALCLIVLTSITLSAQGVPIKSGTSSNTAEVNANGAMLVEEGTSTEATYAISTLNLAVTASESLFNLEAEAGRGFRISQMCISAGQATAAVWTTWQLIRTTTASSGGTVISAESTTTHSVTKMNPGDSNWSGVARTAGTEGTSGAVLDQGTIFVNIAATPPAHPGHLYCREYGLNGGQLPTVLPGVTNGVKLMFTGTAGGAGQSAMIRFIAD